MPSGFKFTSRQIALISTFIAIGAIVRLGVDQIGDVIPATGFLSPFSVIIKIGLSETLSFASGFIYGPIIGFITGFLIIVLSDVASPFGAGSWTPFIASIIGLLGVCGGLIRRAHPRPTVPFMIASAIVLTLLSETLQNLWTALFYNTPIIPTMLYGIPSLVTAMANNVILFPTVGRKTIEFVQESHPANQQDANANQASVDHNVPRRI